LSYCQLLKTDSAPYLFSNWCMWDLAAVLLWSHAYSYLIPGVASSVSASVWLVVTTACVSNSVAQWQLRHFWETPYKPFGRSVVQYLDHTHHVQSCFPSTFEVSGHGRMVNSVSLSQAIVKGVKLIRRSRTPYAMQRVCSYSPTPWSRVLCQKLIVTQLVRKFPEGSWRVHNSPPIPRPCVTLRNKLEFYSEESLAPSPIPQIGRAISEFSLVINSIKYRTCPNIRTVTTKAWWGTSVSAPWALRRAPFENCEDLLQSEYCVELCLCLAHAALEFLFERSCSDILCLQKAKLHPKAVHTSHSCWLCEPRDCNTRTQNHLNLKVRNLMAVMLPLLTSGASFD